MRAIGRYHRRSWLLLAVAVGLLGLAVTGYRAEGRRQAEFVDQAVVVTGIVHEKDYQARSDWVRIEYLFDGDGWSTWVELDYESPGYEVGQRVSVLVDPVDPTRATIEGEAGADWPAVAVVFGLLALVGGGVAVRSALEMKRATGDAVWQVGPVIGTRVKRHRFWPGYQVWWTPGLTAPVKLAETNRFRLARGGFGWGIVPSILDAAQGESRAALLRAPGGSEVFLARAGRSRNQQELHRHFLPVSGPFTGDEVDRLRELPARLLEVMAMVDPWAGPSSIETVRSVVPRWVGRAQSLSYSNTVFLILTTDPEAELLGMAGPESTRRSPIADATSLDELPSPLRLFAAAMELAAHVNEVLVSKAIPAEAAGYRSWIASLGKAATWPGTRPDRHGWSVRRARRAVLNEVVAVLGGG